MPATWFNIPDTACDPDAPATSQLAYAWRDNPIAIAEGASGAPRIQFAAMDTWFSTPGSVGSIAFLGQLTTSSTNIVAGTNYAGSGLGYAGFHSVTNTLGDVGGSVPGSALMGTWLALGSVTYTSTDTRRATMFMRIV